MPTLIEFATSILTLWVVCLGLAMIMGRHSQYLKWTIRTAVKMVSLVIKAFQYAFKVLGTWLNLLEKPKKKPKKRRR